MSQSQYDIIGMDVKPDGIQIVEGALIQLSELDEITRMINELETSGETTMNNMSTMGGSFYNPSHGKVPSSIYWKLQKVRVEHMQLPRPDQTAWYNLKLHIRPTNAERKLLLFFLRQIKSTKLKTKIEPVD